MNYETLFKAAGEKTVRAAIVGAGEFGTSFIFQAMRVPGLEVPAICNRTVQKGVAAYINAGIDESDIRICESEPEVKKAFDSGKCIVVADGLLLMNLPLDILVEGTGNPEVGALYGDAAIKNGMHVAMVSKETDSVAGPMLYEKARKNGLIYTAVEGDQPSLLIGLITWGRVLGLNIICAGKSSEYDFVYDPDAKTVSSLDKKISVPGFDDLWSMNDRTAAEMLIKRSELLSALPQHAVPDLNEMGIVCNATGMKPSCRAFHAPVARTVEVPEFFTTKEQGGILDRAGVVDVVNNLRRPDDASMGGGVFIIVECEDQATWKVLEAKGHPTNRIGSCAMVYHPAHLLGVEAPISVLAAVLLNHATGGETLKPICDLAGCTTKDLRAGRTLRSEGHHHVIDGVDGILLDAFKAQGDNPVPFYLLDNAVLTQDVPAGTTLTCNMVRFSEDSVLRRLRAEQDRYFDKLLS
jgi:predicted homoserine dehydrogenase-like protein